MKAASRPRGRGRQTERREMGDGTELSAGDANGDVSAGCPAEGDLVGLGQTPDVETNHIRPDLEILGETLDGSGAALGEVEQDFLGYQHVGFDGSNAALSDAQFFLVALLDFLDELLDVGSHEEVILAEGLTLSGAVMAAIVLAGARISTLASFVRKAQVDGSDSFSFVGFHFPLFRW